MRLKCIELQGFKTFPNKTKIEFVDGISAVVGPNGSGKSNVSDAMRWVLGEQSVKNLRCSKLEDIIFAGSSSKKPLGFASVKLTFDNRDGSISGFDDEICIMRRYYRSGESEYFINMKQARLKDINELFMDTGIGKDGYSIIGQGKIDAIISAKSGERREIFEEAAGISGCRYRKEDAESKLKQANENLVRIKDIMMELESRVKPLEKQADTAKKYLEYVEIKKYTEISLWVNDIDSSKDRINEHNKKINIINIQKAELDESFVELEKQIEKSINTGNECILKIDDLRKKLSKIEENISESKSQIIIIENNVIHNKENISKFNKEIDEHNGALLNIEKDLSEKVDLCKNKEIEINSKKIELNEKIEDLEKLKNNFSDSQNKGSNLKDKIKLLEDQKHDKEVERLLAHSSIKECESGIGIIDPLIREKEEELNKICDNINKANQEKDEISGHLQKFVNKKQNIEIYLSEHSKVLEKLKNDSQNMIYKAESEQRKIHLLEELEANMEGFSNSVKSVIKESKLGRLYGIIGTVSDIISVPSEYAIATDIALGSSMQNIITESEDFAKKAIYFLKKDRLGRATFLPLTLIKGNKAEINISLKGFKGIASDICNYDPKYSGVMNYLLGRVIIVDNIENAVIASSKFNYRFKVVTIDGQVVNAGGSLTGGSVSNRIGIISRSSEISRLKQIYKETSQKAINLKLQFESLEKEINIKKSDLEGKNSHINELNSAYNALCLKLENLNLEKNNHICSIEEFYVKKNKLHQKKLNLLNEIKSCDYEKDKIEAELLNMNCLLDSEKEVNDKFSKENDNINIKIQQFKIELMSIEKEFEILNIEISSLKMKKNEKYQRIDVLNSDINELKKLIEKSEQELDLLNTHIVELNNQKSNLYDEMDNLKIKREENEKLSVELRKKEREKSQENEILIKELSKLEERGISIHKEYDITMAKLWDEYGMTFGEAKEISQDIKDIGNAKKELNIIKLKIKELGEVNVSSIDEYKDVKNRYLSMKEQVDDIESSQKYLINIINNLNKDMKNMFLNKFNEINKNFGYIINELFGGGRGRLILEDDENVLSCGINIAVKIPGKAEIHLDALSGGEKALVAISLYFAIIRVNPPPFCVLDEIEAALDDVNVDRFATYLRKVCEKTQFILITHRRGTMEEADALYGVTMAEEGISKLLELKINQSIND